MTETDIKIEPCLYCGADYEVCYATDGSGVTHWWVGHDCDCKTYEEEREAIAAHNELCEYVRLGKAAKEAGETLATLADELGNHEDLMDSLALADRAEAFCENPPQSELKDDQTEFADGYDSGFDQGVQACVDRLQEKGGE